MHLLTCSLSSSLLSPGSQPCMPTSCFFISTLPGYILASSEVRSKIFVCAFLMSYSYIMTLDSPWRRPQFGLMTSVATSLTWHLVYMHAHNVIYSNLPCTRWAIQRLPPPQCLVELHHHVPRKGPGHCCTAATSLQTQAMAAHAAPMWALQLPARHLQYCRRLSSCRIQPLRVESGACPHCKLLAPLFCDV